MFNDSYEITFREFLRLHVFPDTLSFCVQRKKM